MKTIVITSAGIVSAPAKTQQSILSMATTGDRRQAFLEAVQAGKVVFHADPGHGWYQVPLYMTKGMTTISGFSYRDKDFAYLEEDCDIARFLENVDPIHANWKGLMEGVRDTHTNNDSPIRRKARFTKD